MEEIKKLEEAVDKFADEMKRRLRDKFKKGWTTWDDPDYKEALELRLASNFITVVKNKKPKAKVFDDAVDIANIAMFLSRFI